MAPARERRAHSDGSGRAHHGVDRPHTLHDGRPRGHRRVRAPPRSPSAPLQPPCKIPTAPRPAVQPLAVSHHPTTTPPPPHHQPPPPAPPPPLRQPPTTAPLQVRPPTPSPLTTRERCCGCGPSSTAPRPRRAWATRWSRPPTSGSSSTVAPRAASRCARSTCSTRAPPTGRRPRPSSDRGRSRRVIRPTSVPGLRLLRLLWSRARLAALGGVTLPRGEAGPLGGPPLPRVLRAKPPPMLPMRAAV